MSVPKWIVRAAGAGRLILIEGGLCHFALLREDREAKIIDVFAIEAQRSYEEVCREVIERLSRIPGIHAIQCVLPATNTDLALLLQSMGAKPVETLDHGRRGIYYRWRLPI